MYPPLQIPGAPSQPFTDFSRWRLLVNDGGRHSWHYLETDDEIRAWPQTTMDKYWLGIDTNLPHLSPPKNSLEAAQNGFTFFKNLQAHDGHWPSQYGGPMYLLPGLVIGSYVTGMSFKDVERLEMIRYIMNHAHPVDGGWGLHTDGPSTVLGTGLNYTTLRILGISADHPICVKSRATLHKLGGVTAIPWWGKFWLSLLHVYDWEGIHPIPPEILLLPTWVPFHPSRWWMPTCGLYAVMSYLYGVRFTAEEDDLILSLRKELYPEDYYKIYWPAQRSKISGADIFNPSSQIYKCLATVLGSYENCTVPPVRRAGIEKAYKLVVGEDENTGYQTHSALSKMFHLVARAHREGPESEAYQKHAMKRYDFMWLTKKGMLVSGMNGTQFWDVAHISEGMIDIGLARLEDNKESLLKAFQWIDEAQIRDDPLHFDPAYRHATKGSWPFSTKEQSYSVSDCAAEGLKTVIKFQYHLDYMPNLLSERRLCDPVDIMLSMQNQDGGFGSYGPAVGPKWLDSLNPDNIFVGVMIESSYVECTSSVVTSLALFRKHFPNYRRESIDACIRRGVDFVHDIQRPEGSWVGSWAICFTYGARFALGALAAVGETYENSESVRRGCTYLLGKQRKDGGWGESYKSMELSTWVDHAESQVVQTSWAALALMSARYPFAEPIEKAVSFVMSKQSPDGSWPEGCTLGIYTVPCLVEYTNYKFLFGIWMLGKAHHYLAELKEEHKLC